MRRASFGFVLSILLSAATLALGAAPAAAPNQAGVIAIASGDARITSRGGQPRPVKVGDVVVEGDVLASGKDGEIHVRMQDSGFIVIRPNSRFEISQYVADGGDSDKAILRLIAGGVRSITGWIGKFNARSYQMQTATATIGIRGTDHETRVIPEGSAEGEPGTYDRVYSGGTSIETADGKVAIAENQAGFQPVKGRGRGRLLASIPAFYRPGPHEAEIAQKHAEIQGQIAARREERRKAVQEKRAALGDSRAKTMELMKENREAAKQGFKPTPEEAAAAKARREALQEDMKAAHVLQEDIQQKRKALDEDWKGGKIPRKEMRERRQAIAAQEKDLAKLQEGIKEKRKAMEEAKDARIDEKLDAAVERQKALQQQVGDTREKRKSLEAEQESAKQEVKSLQKQENQRYREELKADQKGTDPATPAGKN